MREALYKLPMPEERVGQYRVVCPLGRGGQGHVYQAEYAGHLFVLKFFLSRPVCPSGELELDILRHLEHPNVVRVLGHGRWPDPEQGYFYLVMEYVEGQTLRAHALEHNPSARQGATLVLKATRALGAVHHLGVLHRDVKPDNLLVRQADGEPVWVDFGVGHLEGRTTLPRPWGRPRGTPEYMSPEAYRFFQAHPDGEVRYQPGAADEVWALGVTTYEMLTDKLPFGSRMSNEPMVNAILTRQPVAPHEANPRVPVALGQVCLRMLEKEPGQRLADMEAVAAALEAALAGAGEDWDVPLMDPDAPPVRTTEEIPGKVVDRDTWERVKQEYKAAIPRRGRVRKARPGPPPPPEAAAAPEAAAGAHAGAAQPAGVPRRAWTVLAGAVAVALLFMAWAGVQALHGNTSPSPAAVAPGPYPVQPLPLGWRVGQWTPHLEPVGEVAVSGEPSEAGGGAATSFAPSPAPTFATMLRKNNARLKPEEKPALARREAPRCVPTRQETCVVGLCTLLLTGCTSTPQVVRPPPRPADCPPGALETMKKLGISPGDTEMAIFPGGEGGLQRVTVRESTAVETLIRRRESGLGQLGSVSLTGRLHLGQERVYGRFTQARTYTGATYPVCLELVDVDERTLGAERLDVGGPADTAVVISTTYVRAVERFE